MSGFRYDAPPTIGAFMRCALPLRGLMGPFGSGKSVGCCVDLLKHSIEQAPDKNKVRRTRWAIVRNTYRELQDTTRATFEEWIPGAKDPANWSEQDFTCFLRMPLGDGTTVEAEFLFRALDRPEDVKKLLSLELTGAWVNEAREVPYAIVKALLGRVGRFPSMRDGGPTWHGVVMDTNPPDDDSWWYKIFEEEPDTTVRALFRQPGGRTQEAENIGHWEERGRCVGFFPHENHPGAKWVPHLVQGYYDNLARNNALDALWVKVHVDAQYGPTMNGKPIYPEYKDDIHTVTPDKVPPLPKTPLLIGVDFGLTPAVIMAQRDPRDGQLQVIDEMCADDLGSVRFFEDVARYIKTTYPDRQIKGTGDPGGDIRSQVDERTPYDVAAAQGIPLVPAHTNDPERRREAVAGPLRRLTYLGRPGLVVSTKARVLRKAMNGGYCLKRVAAAGEDRFRDTPDKNKYSHPAEGLQYLCLGDGEDAAALESYDRSTAEKPKVKTAGVRRRAR